MRINKEYMEAVVDDFIGKRFGECGHLEVLYRVEDGGKTRTKKYVVHCSECAKDSELFGDGNFISSYHSLRYGNIPCGCASTPRWTDYQWDVRIKRQCSKMGYEYLGYVEGIKGARGKLKLRCLIDGNYWETSTADQFLRGVRCKVCVAKKKSEEATISDEKMTEMIQNSTSRFNDVEKFWRSGRKNARGDLSYWAYKCPVCSKDEYVQNGLCNGVFEGFSGTLLRGQSACRCSSVYRWTKEQREYQINKVLDKELKYEFVEWEGEFNNSESSVVINCIDHGNFTVNISSLINSDVRCQACTKNGYKRALKGYLYIFLVEGVIGDFTGYGITNVPADRVKTHKRNLAKRGQKIVKQILFESDGETIYNLERKLKNTFKLVTQITEGFQTEATYAHSYLEVVKFVENTLADVS